MSSSSVKGELSESARSISLADKLRMVEVLRGPPEQSGKERLIVSTVLYVTSGCDWKAIVGIAIGLVLNKSHQHQYGGGGLAQKTRHDVVEGKPSKLEVRLR